MSIRGTITIECDSCDGELVLDDRDIDVFPQKRGGLELTTYAAEWVEDEDGLLHCPACIDEHPRERDEDDGKSYSDPRDAREDRR
jgi:hypothetical protein